MAWLGYSEEVALATSMPWIERAYDAKMRMLAWQNGGEHPFAVKAPVVSARKMSSALFDAVFGR